MEQLVLAALNKSDFSQALTEVTDFYDDFQKSRLERQLNMLRDIVPGALSVADAVVQFRSKSPEIRSIFDEVERLLKLLLVIPASSATAERSFRALRRLKSYLRSTMSQERLNHVAVTHVHRDRLDAVDLKKIKADFIATNSYRRGVFGQELEVN